jgi:hypothetical protein
MSGNVGLPISNLTANPNKRNAVAGDAIFLKCGPSATSNPLHVAITEQRVDPRLRGNGVGQRLAPANAPGSAHGKRWQSREAR